MYRLSALIVLSTCLASSVYAQSPLPVDTVEQQLLEFLDASAQQQWPAAESLLQSLQAQHPEFRPLKLLTTALAGKTPVSLLPPVAITPATDEFLEPNLRAELYLRQLHYAAPPPAGHYPKAIIRLGSHQPYVYILDQERARLYLYANESGVLRKLADYYSGIGKQGIGKQVRGDHRTPVGIYNFIEYLPDKALPELYGAGALTLDFPNAWDRRLQRTGSGIWLHGVPRGTYSRTPRSSRGCATVSNFIFDALRHHAVLNQTPVILAARIEWQTPQQTAQQRIVFDQLLEQWRLQQEKQSATPVAIQDIDMFFYPGEENLVQMNFKQSSGNTTTDKTLFWKLEDTQWKVIFEPKN
ncbi:MAG TPA: L,D-transpeptidase family protein [Gammaproteobacteria bacterium]